MWVKLDDKAWAEPKVQEVGNEAFGAYCRMLSFCGGHLTDGKVTDQTASFITRPKIVERLAEFGFVNQRGTGLLIPDFLDYNPSKEQVETKREADRKRRAGE